MLNSIITFSDYSGQEFFFIRNYNTFNTSILNTKIDFSFSVSSNKNIYLVQSFEDFANIILFCVTSSTKDYPEQSSTKRILIWTF